jgi:hypothetical protein
MDEIKLPELAADELPAEDEAAVEAAEE